MPRVSRRGEWRGGRAGGRKGKIHRVDPDFGSTLTASTRDSQSDRWANRKIMGQPCEFQAAAIGHGCGHRVAVHRREHRPAPVLLLALGSLAAGGKSKAIPVRPKASNNLRTIKNASAPSPGRQSSAGCPPRPPRRARPPRSAPAGARRPQPKVHRADPEYGSTLRLL
jgi:hypothetical protein